MKGQKTISEITHPKYDLCYRDWHKWRLTYKSGQLFINQYLKKFGKREDFADFEIRKAMTYCPSFAKAAVNEVKNSIYQRMTDISRDGGSTAYQRACAGLDNGVDMVGNTMSSFIGQHVLPELLSMSRVGIYVDMPPVEGETLLDLGSKRPYIYLYETEEIRSWTYDDSSNPNEFGSLLLRDYVYVYDDRTNLPTSQKMRYRHYQLKVDPATGKPTVWVQFYNHEGDATTIDGDVLSDSAINLRISRIPFILLELSDSLLTDISNYQIALMNLESSDVSFVLKANFPFYTEQVDPRAGSPYLRTGGQDNPGSDATANAAGKEEVIVGTSQGRRYSVGAERPDFINPSPEPLLASMKKEEQIKADMRLLLNLSISNLQSRATSAEAKGFDERSLESGLSAIGLELEAAERLIATYWAMYENKPAGTVKYPEKYNLMSDEDRRKSATEIIAMIPKLSSKLYQVEMAKQAVRILLGNRISEDKLSKIGNEFESAPAVFADPDILSVAVQNGYLDLMNAARIACLPLDGPTKAAEEHALRLARIQEAQTPKNDAAARGVPDADTSVSRSGSAEKTQSRDTTSKDTTSPAVRGPGKATS